LQPIIINENYHSKKTNCTHTNLCRLSSLKFDETETFATAGLQIHHQLAALDLAIDGEQRLKRDLADRLRNVVDDEVARVAVGIVRIDWRRGAAHRRLCRVARHLLLRTSCQRLRWQINEQ
jgi:hypothetical protein